MKETKITILLGCVLIAGACFLAYSPAVKGPFIWDDNKYIVGNPLLSAPDGLWRIWFSTDVPSQYFPLVYTAFRLEYQLWGLNPIGYHIVNISLHVLSSLMLWLVLRRLSIPAAFVAAAAFALHPVNVESVAWIAEGKNTLMLVFALLSILFFIEFTLRNRNARVSAFFYVLSLICYILSLFSKTTACVLPLVFVLILWLKEVSLNLKRILQVAPYFILGLAFGILTMWWEKNHQGVGLIDLGLTFLDKTLIATRAIWFYAGKILWPLNLAFSYPRWKINASDPTQYLWLLACLITAGGLWFRRKRLGRGAIAAVIFFVTSLFPMLGFFTLYTFLYSWVADHYAYMATIGLITLVVAAGAKLLAGNKTAGRLIAAIMLLSLGFLTWRQARLYGDPEMLWRDTLQKNPDSWLAHNNLAQILLVQNNLDEAIFHITKSLEGAKDTAEFHPHDIAAAYFNLALAYREQKKYDEAVKNFRDTLKIDPNDTEARFDLADTLESQGKLEEAADQYGELIKINPEISLLHYRLAVVLIRQGNLSSAIIHLHKTLDLEPEYAPALDKLIEIYATRMDPTIHLETKAIEYAELSVEKTNRQNPVLLNLLAMAYAVNRQYIEAIECGEEAFELATAAGDKDFTKGIREELDKYEKQLQPEKQDTPAASP